MGGTVNYFPTGYDKVIRHQARDPIVSLEIAGNDDLIDATMTEWNHVTLAANSDYRKENVITSNVVGNPADLPYVTMTISHGTNGTTQNSTLTLNVTALAQALQGALATLATQGQTLQNHETRITALENA